jgi:hypothetical protein
VRACGRARASAYSLFLSSLITRASISMT